MRASLNQSCRWLVLAVAGCCGLFTTSVWAVDWPQWRGPNRDGKSAETGLLKEWPKDGPPLAWTHPVIANGKLYVRDQDVLLSYGVKAK